MLSLLVLHVHEKTYLLQVVIKYVQEKFGKASVDVTASTGKWISFFFFWISLYLKPFLMSPALAGKTDRITLSTVVGCYENRLTF